MLQQWNLRSRGHHCAVTERPFEDGERHYTAIYQDPASGEYTRRDVSTEAWKQELADRKPFSFWKSVYVRNEPDHKPEIAPKESALTLLQRLIEEDNAYTENARYILAAMLERKRVLSPTDRKHTEQGVMQFYENKKTGDVFIIRDPELRLDEVAGVQEEVATLLGFGGPAADAAKAVGMKITPEGKVESATPAAADEKKPEEASTEAAPVPENADIKVEEAAAVSEKDATDASATEELVAEEASSEESAETDLDEAAEEDISEDVDEDFEGEDADVDDDSEDEEEDVEESEAEVSEATNVDTNAIVEDLSGDDAGDVVELEEEELDDEAGVDEEKEEISEDEEVIEVVEIEETVEFAGEEEAVDEEPQSDVEEPEPADDEGEDVMIREEEDEDEHRR